MAIPTTASRPLSATEQFVDNAADKAEQSLSSAKRVANETLDHLQDGVAKARDNIPGTLGKTATQVEELARRGVEKARELGSGVGQQVERATDQTLGYIKNEPLKSVLIAAAVGAAVAVVVSALSRSTPRA